MAIWEFRQSNVPEKTEIQEQLDQIHAEINGCTVCSEFVPSLKKPAAMWRGEPGAIMIVGIAPGNQELSTNTAFSGQAGKRLDEWLIEAGAKSENPRKGIYFTSVLKCQECPGKFDAMAHRCRRFLNRQLDTVRPELVVTLGERPYEQLRFAEIPYAAALCQMQSSEGLLLTQFGFDYKLLPWPHPSGLNRQLNNSQIRARLVDSFRFVHPYLMSS
jgi:uracil-DNA glycosylase family 4